MSKKKVTAPLTYNPGKGRPQEHLAYLNWQEMQALRRLNGQNTEVGPKGLPSFPPADAIGSSSKSTSSSGYSGGGGNYASIGGGQGSGVSYGGGSKTNTGGSISGGTSYGGGGNKTSGSGTSTAYGGPSIGGGNKTGGMSSAGSRSVGTGNTNDTRARSAAAVSDAVKIARESSPLNSDARKGGINTINVGPVGTPVKIGGGQISGAISRVAAPQKTAPVSVSQQRVASGDVAPQPQYKTAADMHMAMVNDLRGRFNAAGAPLSNAQVAHMMKVISGEAAGESMKGRTAVAGSMVNRIAAVKADPKKYHGFGTSFDELMKAYTASTDPNVPFKASVPGSLEFGKSIAAMAGALGENSPYNRTTSNSVRNATHYHADYVQPNWSKPSFEQMGKHLFGTADAVSPSDIAPIRDDFLSKAKTPQMGTSQFAESAQPSTRKPTQKPSDLAAQRLVAASLDGYIDPAVMAGKRPDKYAKTYVDRIAPEKEINDRLVSLRNPDGTIVQTTASDIDKMLSQSGVPDSQRIAAINSLINRTSQEPQPITTRSVIQTASGLAPKLPSVSQNPYATTAPSKYSGYGEFTPPKITASVAQNPYDTTAPSKYSGYGEFTPPEITASVAQNPYEKTGSVVPPRPSIDVAPGVQPGADVLQQAPNKPEGTYSISTSVIPSIARKSFVEVLKNPDKIVDIANSGGLLGKWAKAGDTAALKNVANGIKELKAMGAKVNKDGTISIPDAAKEKAQRVFNDLAQAYSRSGKDYVRGSFSEGIGATAEKMPVTKEQIAQWNKDVRSYLSNAEQAGKIPATPDSSYTAAKLAGAGYGSFDPTIPNATTSLAQKAGDFARGIGSLIAPASANAAEAPAVNVASIRDPAAATANIPAPAQVAAIRDPAAATMKPSSPVGIASLPTDPRVGLPTGQFPAASYLENSKIMVDGKDEIRISEALDRYELTPDERRIAAGRIADAAGENAQITEDELNTILQDVQDSPEIEMSATTPSGTYWTGVGMTDEQQEKYDEAMAKEKTAGRIAQGVTGVPVNAIIGGIRKLTSASLDDYAKATITERRKMEEQNPALVGWARLAGIDAAHDYSFYKDWANKMGLTGGVASGTDKGTPPIYPEYPQVASTGKETTKQDASSYGRPYLYYQWDLGINIPSPDDPKYIEYQKYVAERLAAQKALGLA